MCLSTRRSHVNIANKKQLGKLKVVCFAAATTRTAAVAAGLRIAYAEGISGTTHYQPNYVRFVNAQGDNILPAFTSQNYPGPVQNFRIIETPLSCWTDNQQLMYMTFDRWHEGQLAESRSGGCLDRVPRTSIFIGPLSAATTLWVQFYDNGYHAQSFTVKPVDAGGNVIGPTCAEEASCNEVDCANAPLPNKRVTLDISSCFTSAALFIDPTTTTNLTNTTLTTSTFLTSTSIASNDEGANSSNASNRNGTDHHDQEDCKNELRDGKDDHRDGERSQCRRRRSAVVSGCFSRMRLSAGVVATAVAGQAVVP